MRPIPSFLAVLLLAIPLANLAPLGGRTARAADPTINELVKAFQADLKSDDADVRARAYDRLHLARDPSIVDVIVKSLRDLKSQQTKIRREQDRIEAAYEKQFEKKLDADQAFESSSMSSRDMDNYNKKVRSITRKLDGLRLELKSLENDFTRTRALFDSAVTAVTKVLDNIPDEALAAGLEGVRTGWLESSDPEDRVRWVDALADLDRPGVAEQLRAAVADLERDEKVRAAALESLGARKDPQALDYAAANLRPEAPWDMQAAAIHAMALLHKKECIEPLILFLKRDDIARLREDAHVALMGLTGEHHGPYFEPWDSWWTDNREAFEMPEKTVADSGTGRLQEGRTFYGIHTFSNRILYILDISGSMDQAPQGKDEAGNTITTGPPKIDTARKELIGAINSLDEGGLFNIIFFNHEVVAWQNKMVEVTESQKRRAVQWVEEQTPLGTTNIYDALEKGFGIALKATGSPLIDTIFFLTDGRPTSGKIQDSARILQEVIDWNKSARLKVHTIGIGDHDAELLEAIALATGGQYVSRDGQPSVPGARDGR